jgi:hypothetical protein
MWDSRGDRTDQQHCTHALTYYLSSLTHTLPQYPPIHMWKNKTVEVEGGKSFKLSLSDLKNNFPHVRCCFAFFFNFITGERDMHPCVDMDVDGGMDGWMGLLWVGGFECTDIHAWMDG